jgi:hypothetical protein
VVQARRVRAPPAGPVVRPGVRVPQRRSRAAGPRAPVRHDVLADGGRAVEVLRLVAVDDQPGVVRAWPAARVPDGRSLKMYQNEGSTSSSRGEYSLLHSPRKVNTFYS